MLYGGGEVVSNIHYISHILEDVDRFGSLSDISTYPFENFLREIKSHVQPSKSNLEQISRRLAEISLDTENNQINFDTRSIEKAAWFPELKYETKDFPLERGLAYRFIRISPNVILSTKNVRDKWFITRCGNIISMKYATHVNDSYLICGVPIVQKSIFFKKPYSSSITDIYISNGNLQNIEVFFKHTQIKSKLMCLSYQDKYVFIPLLHSLDEMNEMSN